MILIRKATHEDAETVANLVSRLLAELSGEKYTGVDDYMETAISLLDDGRNYKVFLANNEQGKSVGLISLSESEAIYTLGKFGIIQELYVDPDYRSSHVGSQLLERAVTYAKECKWSRLEVGTPDPETWTRTAAFYKRNGFKQVGLKMKMVL